MTKASLTFYNIVKVGTDFRVDVSQKKPFFLSIRGLVVLLWGWDIFTCTVCDKQF